MNDYITAVVSALVGAIIGTIGTYFTLRYNYRQLFADTVSKSRNKWLDEMRENISIMLAEARKKLSDGYDKTKFYIVRNQVLLRLNGSEPKHALLKKEIERYETCQSLSEIINIEENILIISEPLLKREWERVKKEAKGAE